MKEQPARSHSVSGLGPPAAASFWSSATSLPRVALIAGLVLSAIQLVDVVSHGHIIAVLSFAVEALIVALGFWLFFLVAYHHIVFVRLRLAGLPRRSLAAVCAPTWLKWLLAIQVTVTVAYAVDLVTSPATPDQLTHTVQRLVASGTCVFALAECWIGYVCSVRIPEMRARLSRI